MDTCQHVQPVAPILQVTAVSKRFGGNLAVDEVSFQLFPGEVLAIVGENGAGKSTLVGLISGEHVPDQGSIVFEGHVIGQRGPKHVRELGIETVYQDLALADNLDAAHNVFLGREPRQSRLLGIIDRKTIDREAHSALTQLGFILPDKRRLVRSLSGGQRQAVAIARAVQWNPKVLILDEPTAAVGVEGRSRVRSLIKSLRQQGRSVIYVTPNAREALEIGDRLIVLRRGRKVAEKDADQVTVEEVVAYILGARTDAC